jgi:hypothetical protein
MGLAISLNALNPADLPGDADAWGEFNHMVAVGQRLFGRPIWQSTAVLEWLRECMNRCRRGKKTAPNGWLPNWGDVPGIERFRNALSASLKRESADSPSRSENKVVAAVVEAVDSLILRMAALDLAVLASKFDDELDVARRGSGAAKVVLGETMLPLFPGELVSGDRTRVIRPLTTPLQLKSHGIELNNCLAGSSMQYIRKGSKGTSFVVAVFDKETGSPLSTAHIAVRRHKGPDRYGFVVRQHTANRNSIPSRQCSRSIAELIQFCRTDEVRKHLEDSWKDVRHTGYDAVRYAWSPVMDAMVTKALRRTLTDAIYDELLTNVRNK